MELRPRGAYDGDLVLAAQNGDKDTVLKVLDKGANVNALYEQVREKLRTIPGVRDVTLSNAGLFGGEWPPP